MRSLIVLMALAWCVAAGPVSAASPEPSGTPTPRDLAISAVRAMDPRFADIDDYVDAVREQAKIFDFAPTLARSWIKVLPTFGTDWDIFDDAPPWLVPGDRVVEVMLADDCEASVQRTTDVDPCGWRHRWLYRVLSNGEVVLLFEDGAPDDPVS